MRILMNFLHGAAIVAALTVPAAALDHEFGAVNVASDHYTDVVWSHFGGPVDHFSITPNGDAVQCDHLTINYMDGTSHDVFSGYVAAGQSTTISLPAPNDGRIHDIDFSCKAEHVDGTRITLSAVTDNWPRDWDVDRPAQLTTEAHPY